MFLDINPVKGWRGIPLVIVLLLQLVHNICPLLEHAVGVKRNGCDQTIGFLPSPVNSGLEPYNNNVELDLHTPFQMKIIGRQNPKYEAIVNMHICVVAPITKVCSGRQRLLLYDWVNYHL